MFTNVTTLPNRALLEEGLRAIVEFLRRTEVLSR